MNITHFQWDDLVKIVSSVMGGVLGLMFGDLTTILGVLAGAMIADYVTGILSAGSRSELSSKVGYKAIRRKIGMLIVVSLAHGVDLVLGTGNIWRDLSAGFYIGNEVLSVFENLARMNVLVPPQMREVLHKFIEKKPEDK